MDIWPPDIKLNMDIVRQLRRQAEDGANARALSASTNLGLNNLVVCRYFIKAFLLTIKESLGLYSDSGCDAGPPAIEVPPVSVHRSVWSDPRFQEAEHKAWQETVDALVDVVGIPSEQLCKRGGSTLNAITNDRSHNHTIFDFQDGVTPWTVTYGRDPATSWEFQMLLPGAVKLYDPACPVCLANRE